MYIKNNHIANQLYVPYTKSVRNLAQSARRLATGEKIPTAADGGGELSVADRWQQMVRGTSKLIAGMENTMGYLATQDEVLNQATQVLQRMSELAASALDTTKNTNDRIALESEFDALESEIINLSGRRYNGISLFGNVLSVRYDITSIGAGPGQTVTLSSIDLNGLATNIAGLTLSQLGSASNALISITSRLKSINIMKAYAGNNSNEISRTIDFTRQHVRNLGQAENFVRNIDIAIEAGNFTKEQVILSASQSVLTQANGIIQSAMQFLG